MKTQTALLLLLLVFAGACTHPHGWTTEPAPPGHSRNLSLRFHFRGVKARGSGKVIARFGSGLSQLYLLDPVGQPLGVAYARGEEVTLINRKRRLYWTGSFRDLVQYTWGLGLTLAEFESLLWEGRLPVAEEGGEARLKVQVKRRSGAPRSIVLSRGREKVTIVVSKREYGSAPLRPPEPLTDLASATLDEIFQA